MLITVSMCIKRDGHATYQCDLPLLHPILLLLLQPFNVVWHRPSNGMRVFKRSGNARVALDLLGCVVHDQFGDGEDIAEACRHVECWLVVTKSGGGHG